MSHCKFLLFVLMFAGAFGLQAAERSDEQLFRDGTILLRHGDYAKAATSFELLKSKGVKSPQLYCNLGNAYFQMNSPGKAISSYEKGLLLAPLDTQLTHNLRIVNNTFGLPVSGTVKLHAANSLPVVYAAEKGPLLIAFLFLITGMLFLALCFRLLKSDLIKSLVKCGLLVSILLFVVITSLSLLQHNSNYAITVENNTKVKTGPGVLAKEIFGLPEGEKIEILNYYKGWYKIKRYNDAEGWVQSPGLDIIK